MRNFWKNKTVLVTGGGGFVGSHLVIRLVELGANKIVVLERAHPKKNSIKLLTKNVVEYVTGDVSNTRFVEVLFKKHQFDLCFHLAAQPLVSQGGLSPLSTMEINIMGTVNILESARQHRVKGVVLASTTHVYGNNVVPFLEEYFPRPSSPYETSKACADMLAQTYALYYKLPVAIGRFVNIYGPGDINERIVPRSIQLILQGQKPEIFNDKVNRDFLYIDDAISGYVSLAEKIVKLGKENANIIYNFGTGRHYSSKHIVETILRLMDRTDIKPIYVKSKRKQEIIDQYVSIKKIKKALHWDPKYSLEDGLKETIKWHTSEWKKRKSS